MARRRPRIKFVLLACLAVAVVAVLGFTFAKQQELIAHNVVEAAKFTPKPVPKATAATVSVKVASFKAATDKLRTTDAPFVLQVVGDSTGFPDQGWLVTALQDIQESTGRVIALHTWNNETAKYDPARIMGEGEPTLTVWNGSAPGKDAAYSLNNLSALMSVKNPDMLILNHGHNVKLTGTIRSLVVQAAEKAGPKTAVAIMKQNPESSAGQAFQASRMAMVDATAKEFKGVQLIDAYSAFDVTNPKLLMSDGIHPTAEGYRLWADVFLRRLGFA
jgi:hypothetical protein